MKIIDDILEEVDKEIIRTDPSAKRKYIRITETVQSSLIRKVFDEKKTIF